jgi:hypothetical protein
VDRGQVCEAGFVVHKWVSNIPLASQVNITQAVKAKRKLNSELLRFTETQRKAKKQLDVKTETPKGVVVKSLVEVREKKIVQLQEKLTQATADLQAMSAVNNITHKLKGWVRGEHSGFGSWQDVEATPQAIEEEIFPLYPLIPDPSKNAHSASGKTVWFGIVPTQSADVDADGNARFDDESLYEIRCLARRHKPPCPLKSTRGDCPGEIVWSEPTESYKLAPFFDFDGAGHKPINIKLPDIEAVKEQAMRGPIGKGNNIRMIAPAGSMLGFKGNGMDLPTKKDSTGSQICFFSIILITIVALFVLRLFLPIVVFIFQLWFLLRLKLCILPSIEMDGGLAVDLDIHGPEFSANIEANFAADFEIGGKVVEDFADLKAVFQDPTLFDKADTMDKNLKDHILEQIGSLDSSDANRENVDGFMQAALDGSTDFSEHPADARLAGTLPDVTDGLIYFDKVTVT